LTLLKILSHARYGRPQRLSYLTVAAAFAVAAPARAQIYTWTDANGHMVLSNTRPGSAAPSPSYAVPKATGIRVTRAVAPSRARAYDDLISEQSRSNGVRADLVRAVMQVESGFNPYARSPKGAMGLMQLMPATAKQYRVANPFNPSENVRAGVAYLRELIDRYDNNEELALAAYNAGPGAVDKHGQTVPPYRETRDYVSRINKISSPASTVPGTTLYRQVDIMPDGREIPKYTDKKPGR